MTKLQWDKAAERIYEVGLDHGVLYLPGQDGVPWNGLTSVSEKPAGESTPYYMDGEIYLLRQKQGTFEATINAVTYPDSFQQCEGMPAIRPGLYASRQRRTLFGLSYRTLIGDAIAGVQAGYKIHLIYNALANPAQRERVTMSDDAQMLEFSWDIITKPQFADGMRGTSYVIIDSRFTNPIKLQNALDILYGTDVSQPRLLDLTELIELYDDPLEFSLTDHGDGTYTILAPNSNLTVLSSGQWIFDWPTAEPVDADTFTISST